GFGDAEAVHAGHVQVEQDEREGTAHSSSALQRRNGLVPAIDRARLHSPTADLTMENLTIHRVVVDDENVEIDERREIGDRRIGLCQVEARREMECAADARLA